MNFGDFAPSEVIARFVIVEDVHGMNRISSLVGIDADFVCGVV